MRAAGARARRTAGVHTAMGRWMFHHGALAPVAAIAALVYGDKSTIASLVSRLYDVDSL